MTPEKRGEIQESFLKAFERTANVSAAALEAGISRQSVYDWQEKDEAFNFRYNQARAIADDVIRGEIHRRAITGTDKPVYQGGRMVGTVKEYSDTLLIFLAKSRMPEFREKQQIEHTGELTLSLKALEGIRERARN